HLAEEQRQLARRLAGDARQEAARVAAVGQRVQRQLGALGEAERRAERRGHVRQRLDHRLTEAGVVGLLVVAALEELVELAPHQAGYDRVADFELAVGEDLERTELIGHGGTAHPAEYVNTV